MTKNRLIKLINHLRAKIAHERRMIAIWEEEQAAREGVPNTPPGAAR